MLRDIERVVTYEESQVRHCLSRKRRENEMGLAAKLNTNRLAFRDNSENIDHYLPISIDSLALPKKPARCGINRAIELRLIDSD